jgi:hypothetical protein
MGGEVRGEEARLARLDLQKNCSSSLVVRSVSELQIQLIRFCWNS